MIVCSTASLAPQLVIFIILIATTDPIIVGIYSVYSVGLSIGCVLRFAGGLKYAFITKLLLSIGVCLPLISLLVTLKVREHAASELKLAGYDVKFTSATKPQVSDELADTLAPPAPPLPPSLTADINTPEKLK